MAGIACAPPPSDGYAPEPTDPITLGHQGVPGNAPARGASTSADGRWTAFSSSASNLVAGDTNDADDVFLRDNSTGRVIRVAEGATDVPTISRTGRFVGYKASMGSDPVHFGVYDRDTGVATTWTDVATLTVPVVTDGGEYAVTGVGSSLGLYSTYCLVRDLAAGTVQDCPHPAPVFGAVALTGISGNGRHVMYHWSDKSGGDTSGYFLYDVLADDLTPLSGTFVSLGISNVVSDDGSTIVATGFGASYPPAIHDVDSGAITAFPVEPDGTVAPVGMSPDGRYAAFAADATNLVPGDTNETIDVFRLDLTSGELVRASTAMGSGAQLEHGAWMCGRATGQVFDDGRVCVYALDEISPTDSNGFPDAFLVPVP